MPPRLCPGCLVQANLNPPRLFETLRRRRPLRLISDYETRTRTGGMGIVFRPGSMA
jgi:hypothetical protein